MNKPQTDRPDWRRFFSHLSLVLDQIDVYAITGNLDEVRSHVQEARRHLDLARSWQAAGASGAEPCEDADHRVRPTQPVIEPKIDALLAVGPLAEALDSSDASTRTKAAALLTQLLPHLNAEHGALLNDHHRRALYRQLRIENTVTRPDLLMAILQALEQMGDTQALRSVQRLAVSAAVSPPAVRVKRRAWAALAVLQDHAARARIESTLLRASIAPDSMDGRLLRPASSAAAPSDPARLLRPTAPEEHNA